MKIHPLHEGWYTVGWDKKFIPFDPGKDNMKDRPASLLVHISPFLVETQDQLILLDTGLGYLDAQGQPLIYERIKDVGYEPSDVTLVAMSHLHFDHAGGMARKDNSGWKLNFPSARYLIGEEEYLNAYNAPGKSYDLDMLHFMQSSGAIELLATDGEVLPGIKVARTGGHTAGHLAYWVQDNGEIAFYGGDVMPEPGQVIRRFKAKYDLDPELSAQLRQGWALEAARSNWICLFYHEEDPAVAKISLHEDTIRIQPY